MEWIGFVAQRARARRKDAAARLAAIDADRFELLDAAAFGNDPAAVAGRATLRRLDRRALGCNRRFGPAGHLGSIAWPVCAVTDSQGGGRGPPVTNLQARRGAGPVTDMQGREAKREGVARRWLPRSRAVHALRGQTPPQIFTVLSIFVE